jgi:hypothetical protein
VRRGSPGCRGGGTRPATRAHDTCGILQTVTTFGIGAPVAHADVVAIDAAPALKVTGVLGVFTGRDLVADFVGTIPTLIAERRGGIHSRDGSPFAERRGIRGNGPPRDARVPGEAAPNRPATR